MEAYTGFAAVYDLFMDNIPYGEWADYLHGLLLEHGIGDGLLLDLGCGTGILTEMFADFGYDMIGVDSSAEMLEAAFDKRVESGHDILYLQQDMRELELYGTVRAVLSTCDALNYILSEDELCHVFSLVNNYLDPGGLFVFDFNTEHVYRDILGDRVLAEDREESSFIWDNRYYAEEKINEYDLSIFVRGEDGRYDKFEETHLQRAYSLGTIKRLLAAAGMEFAAAYDAFTRDEARPDSGRICVIAKEHGKKA